MFTARKSFESKSSSSTSSLMSLECLEVQGYIYIYIIDIYIYILCIIIYLTIYIYMRIQLYMHNTSLIELFICALVRPWIFPMASPGMPHGLYAFSVQEISLVPGSPSMSQWMVRLPSGKLT